MFFSLKIDKKLRSSTLFQVINHPFSTCSTTPSLPRHRSANDWQTDEPCLMLVQEQYSLLPPLDRSVWDEWSSTRGHKWMFTTYFQLSPYKVVLSGPTRNSSRNIRREGHALNRLVNNSPGTLGGIIGPGCIQLKLGSFPLPCSLVSQHTRLCSTSRRLFPKSLSDWNKK